MWNLYIVLQSRIKDCTLHYQSIISNWCVKIILYEENYDICYHPNNHLWTLPSIVYYSIIDRLYALRNQHYVNQCICTLINILKLDIYHWKHRYWSYDCLKSSIFSYQTWLKCFLKPDFYDFLIAKNAMIPFVENKNNLAGSFYGPCSPAFFSHETGWNHTTLMHWQ